MSWASTTHRGRVRAANEDAVLAGPHVFAVADGVGGALGGRDASSAAIAALVRADHVEQLTIDALNDVFTEINRAIRNTLHDGAGTTLSGVAMTDRDDAELILFNIGDSRVYRFREGSLVQLSEDHSVVAQLVRDGAVTQDAARTHPDRRIITRALGAEEQADVDVSELRAEPGDRYLICSDGLTTELHDDELADVLAATSPAAATVQELLERTLAKGGRDNVSIVMLDVMAEDAPNQPIDETRRNASRLRSRRRRRPSRSDR